MMGWGYAGEPDDRFRITPKMIRYLRPVPELLSTDEACLIKSASLTKSHFAYLEDIDVSYRAMIYGYKNRFCASALVYHVGSGTSGSKYNTFKVKLSARNSVWLNYKNMPLFAADPEFHPITFGISGEIFIFLQNRIWNRLQKRNQRRNPWSVQMPQGSVSDGASRQLYPDRICPDTPHIRLCGRLAEKKIIA